MRRTLIDNRCAALDTLAQDNVLDLEVALEASREQYAGSEGFAECLWREAKKAPPRGNRIGQKDEKTDMRRARGDPDPGVSTEHG